MTTREQHERFHLRTLDDLEKKAEQLSLSLPLSDDLSILGTSLDIADKTAPNRFAVHPMEGFDAEPDGAPGPLSFRRYKRYAAGGFGLIWMEATAVMHEGRSNPCQLCLHDGNWKAYAKLVQAIRATAKETYGHDVVIVIQLTHSGRYSKPTGVPEPIIAHHSPILDPKHNLPEDYPLVTDDYLDQLQDTYENAARLAAQAGFDGIGIKSCHRYLISELHASFTREGKYGGSFENRTRLLRETLARIKQNVPNVFITTRMNAFDAISYPYGFGVSQDDYRVPDLTEPLQLVSELQKLGAPVLNVSIGNPYFNPHFGRPYDFPIKGLSVPDDHPLTGIARFMGVTRTIQEAYPTLPIVGSGYTWLRHLMPNVAAAALHSGGASLMGIGRGAFAYPQTPNDILTNGKMDAEKCCVSCSACTQIMRDGIHTGCVVRDQEVYGKKYRLARRFALDHLTAEAKRCRDCEEPTCSSGCPAGIDIPRFVRAFADGDIPTAYETLRASNLLPEMCAYVCPSDVQCEGCCVEKTFCDTPIPIRDIQLVTCQIARRQNLTGTRIPDEESGRRVAIVGGGPAGMAAAIHLIEKGHKVSLFERSEKLGGTPDSIIPANRYGNAKTEVEAIVEPALSSGRLDIQLSKELGSQIKLASLAQEYDAVLLSIGLSGSTSLGTARGVTDALTFLRQAKSGTQKTIPNKVAVLGGGNTAMDAAVAARELGAQDVYLVYRRSFNEMPAWPTERQKFLATGGHAMILTQPIGYETDNNGKLIGLKIARTSLGDADNSGRRRPTMVPGTESTLEVDLVIEAIGQTIPPSLSKALDGLSFTRNGLVKTISENSFQTVMDKIYAAGDLINGGTTAVQCISEGMRAAVEIDAALTR